MRTRIAILPVALIVALGGCTTIPGDDLITARVKSGLGRAVPHTAVDMTVNTNDGIVDLRGPVISTYAAERAVDAAAQVDGVKAVQYELWLAQSPR